MNRLRCGTAAGRRGDPAHARRPGAFTLIEVLVVVAIIALLVAILLPSLSLARQQARRAKCSANVRSLCQALYLYAFNDTRGYMPWTDGAVPQYWVVWRRDVLGLKLLFPALTEKEKQEKTGQMDRYLPDKHVLECPSDVGDRHPTPVASYPTWAAKLYDFWGTSYYYNCRDNLTIHNEPGSVARASVSKFQRPTELVLCGDMTLHSHGRSDPDEWRRHLWHNRREPWANLGFADGHVGYHKMDPFAPAEVIHKWDGTTLSRISTKGKGYNFVNPPTDPALSP